MYEPFGSLKTATYGNTLKLVQDWGNDGRLASKRLFVTSGGVNRSLLSYGYDNDDNMVSIVDGVDATRSASFAFDSMNRIVRIDSSSGAIRREDQLHDKNGNRVRVERRVLATDTLPASSDSYTTTAGTNRLASITTPAGTRSLSYDGRGNLATETRPGTISASTSYDGYARLTSYIRTGEASLTFTYNGLDDRVREVRGTTTRRYLYDGQGRILGEYGVSATDVIAEHLWLSPDAANDNMPFGGDDGVNGYAPLAIASAPTGGTAQIVWVHGNHMGVPLTYTSSTGAIITPPAFTQSAFPGQMKTLADLYYNRYRDYDPTTGRYIQADPIGLNGDPNPYAYAMNNPLKYSDPTGKNAGAVRGAVVVGEVAGEGLFVLCRLYPRLCMATIGAAAVWVYKAINPTCPDLQTPTLEIRKEGQKKRRSGWGPYHCTNPGCDAPHGGATGTSECPDCDRKRKNGYPMPGPTPRPLD
jgi:RHS repeat-associated protein